MRKWRTFATNADPCSEVLGRKVRQLEVVLAPAPVREFRPSTPAYHLHARRVLLDAEGGRDELRPRHADERRGFLARVVAVGRDPPRREPLDVQEVEEIVEVEGDEVIPNPRPEDVKDR